MLFRVISIHNFIVNLLISATKTGVAEIRGVFVFNLPQTSVFQILPMVCLKKVEGTDTQKLYFFQSYDGYGSQLYKQME